MYLLTCEYCDKTHTVTTRQAGQSIPCVCGRPCEVPSLRDIRQLPSSETKTAPKKAGSWTLLQGNLFSVGLLLVVVGSAATAYFAWQRSKINTDPLRVEDIQFLQSPAQLTPSQSWDAWETAFRDFDLDVRNTPQHQINRERSQELLAYEIVAAAGGILGLIAVLSAFFMK